MKGTHLLSLITAILWALMVLMGVGGIDGVRSQHVPGFPSAGQMRYYIYLPVGCFVLVIAAWAVAARWRWFKAPAVALITLALLAMPGYLFFYTGGV